MVKQGKSCRIGIYGGTFNPVHYGHLLNAESVRQEYSLDRILFIPDKKPVHKPGTDLADPYDRMNMLKLAVSGNSYFEVSDIEIKSEKPSYTIYTLESLAELYPDAELFLIIGSDSFNELDTWRSYMEIISRVHVIVMKRPDSTELRSDIMALGDSFLFHDNPMIEISSTTIREHIKKGLSARYMTPDSVIEYIYSKGLYKIE